ncbi:MAG: hypothetical protein OHK0022_61440 [Roseiflexaceae bacterium]
MSDVFTHRVEIYTANLVLTGSYDMAIYRRMTDAINGEQRRYVPLRDATVAPLERPQQAQRVPQLLVDREDIMLVAALDEATPPPDYLPPEPTRGVVPISVMIFTGAFVMRATLHKRPDFSLADALDRQTNDYLPLTGVQIFPLLGGFAPVSRPVAALLRARIVALYQVGEPPRPEPAPAAPATLADDTPVGPAVLEEDAPEPQN